MASLTDILTTAKNIVTAINNATTTAQQIAGTQTKASISTTTVVSTSAGRFVTLSIVTGGTTTGTVYDANTTTDTSRALYTIPTTIGRVIMNVPVVNGIVVVPGTGQVVTVTYS